MQVRRLDHVNIQTTQLNKMVAWYEEILGLRPARAGLSIPGRLALRGRNPGASMSGRLAAEKLWSRAKPPNRAAGGYNRISGLNSDFA